ncbi:ERBB receptor feedback inhibitor 1 [Paramormyrops kingsleyae]|uniref:ERBB receptor feedback inhibitor 1 n=1 Tax=Paramormyrops kingsleyae TaxID=1676925 RepID=A0A3B3SMQ3_9TELE|nr:ERBB receptor feedback inhibitor 1-like [Paramormyrops kingsleyae]XP_023697376.1 ERBB receptor feedback inhibitor 1-like [Paramormyrops kingsleyae]
MRPQNNRTMSAASLSVPGIRSPLRGAFAHGSRCHVARSYWEQQHDLNNLCFGLDAAPAEFRLKSQQRVPVSDAYDGQSALPCSPQSPGAQRLPPKKFRPSHLTLTPSPELSSLSSPEGDQVVPSFQRLSVYEHTPPLTSGRGTKPLPPLPGPADLSSDEAMDNEVEFFTSTDESQRLVPESCAKPVAFRYGALSRRSFRGCGQINYAYYEGPSGGGVPEEEAPSSPQAPPPVTRQPATREVPRQHERPQRRLRRSHSGPVGSLNKPAGLRLSCTNPSTRAQDKPEVPPRIPIPPRPSKGADLRRWSAEVPSGGCSDEDKPPKVPPREPRSCGSPRTPSPKSLPIYINGVMPATQSFAPNPKYVSRALQRQHSLGSQTPRSPCILPIMENGKKASTTHYFLLPKRPVYLDGDKIDKFFKETDSESDSPSSLDWDCEARQKAHIHLV